MTRHLFLQPAAAALIGGCLAMAATPAAAQCDPSVCAGIDILQPINGEAVIRPMCLFDLVVWADRTTHRYYLAGTPNYGRTRRGSYMCSANARAADFKSAMR